MFGRLGACALAAAEAARNSRRCMYRLVYFDTILVGMTAKRLLWPLMIGAVLLIPRWWNRPRLAEDADAFRFAAAEPPSGKRQLAVLLHGYTGSRETLGGVIDVVRKEFPEAAILAPEYPAGLFSNEDPLQIVRRLLDAIETAYRAGQYESILLVGNSFGAPIMRKAYVCGVTGCPEDPEVKRPPAKWAEKVDRLVLLAGMSRGWATHCEQIVAERSIPDKPGEEPDCRAKQLPLWKWAFMEIGQLIARPLGIGHFIMSARRGEPFIADLRLQWQALDPSKRRLVVQILGSTDDLVSSFDNVDIFTALDFKFIKVEDTGHAEIVQFDSSLAGQARKEAFRRALRIRADESTPLPFDESKLPNIDPSIEHLVFVLHGIRDQGECWAGPLKKELESRDPKLHVWAESYGRFPALYFLQPWRMQANVRWFVDQYTQQVSLYPNAKKISFIGHSNGTFILSKMLEDYRQTRFHRIIFAGSVVPKRFEWSRFRGRFRSVRNIAASHDYIVAALPGFFEFVPVSVLDVGSAGHNGFDDNAAIFDLAKTKPPRFVDGGHSAALDSRAHEALASFITGEGVGCDPDCPYYDVPAELITPDRKPLAETLYSYSVAVWLAAAFIVAGAIYWAGRKIGWPLAACMVIAAVGLFLRFY